MDVSYTKVTAQILQIKSKAFKLRLYYWTEPALPYSSAVIWCPKSLCKVVDDKVTEIADFILEEFIRDHPNAHTLSFDMSAHKLGNFLK